LLTGHPRCISGSRPGWILQGAGEKHTREYPLQMQGLRAHGGQLPSWPVINAPFMWVTLLGAGTMHAQTQAGHRVLTQEVLIREGADLSKAP
jgi:hypothetical protein